MENYKRDIPWLFILFKYFQKTPQLFQEKLNSRDEFIDRFLLQYMHGYLRGVQIGILNYDVNVRINLNKLVYSGDFDIKTENLAYYMVEICNQIESLWKPIEPKIWYESTISSLIFVKQLKGVVKRKESDRIILSLDLPSGKKIEKEIPISELQPMAYHLEPGKHITIQFTGNTLLINDDERLQFNEEQGIPQETPSEREEIDPLWKVIVEEKKPNMEPPPMPNIAYQYYLAHENEWLNDPDKKGKYIWIVENKEMEISENLTDLLKKAERSGCDPNKSIVRRIGKYPKTVYLG